MKFTTEKHPSKSQLCIPIETETWTEDNFELQHCIALGEFLMQTKNVDFK